jgi:hypothetical protein
MKFLRNSFWFYKGLASHTRDMHINTMRTLLKIIYRAVQNNENFKCIGHCPQYFSVTNSIKKLVSLHMLYSYRQTKRTLTRSRLKMRQLLLRKKIKHYLFMIRPRRRHLFQKTTTSRFPLNIN